jgi:hypothetical protein
MLFATYTEANTPKTFIDETGCGGSCDGAHAIVELSPSMETDVRIKSVSSPDAERFEARK